MLPRGVKVLLQRLDRKSNNDRRVVRVIESLTFTQQG